MRPTSRLQTINRVDAFGGRAEANEMSKSELGGRYKGGALDCHTEAGQRAAVSKICSSKAPISASSSSPANVNRQWRCMSTVFSLLFRLRQAISIDGSDPRSSQIAHAKTLSPPHPDAPYQSNSGHPRSGCGLRFSGSDCAQLQFCRLAKLSTLS